jgi:hypothetical protein
MLKTFLVTGIFFVAFRMAGIPITGPQFVLAWLCFYVVTKLAKKNTN